MLFALCFFGDTVTITVLIGEHLNNVKVRVNEISEGKNK
jgi:hypothetical protein